MKLHFFVCALLIWHFTSAQGDRDYLQGYEREISGARFGYHSPLPYVNMSLLIRGRQDYHPIEWETETVPEDYGGEFVSFFWLFAMDVTATPVDFALSINNQEYISFKSSKISRLGPSSFKGRNNTEITLQTTMLDRHRDQMGFAVLKVPADVIEKGKPVRLKISSNSENNDAWYMVYKAKLEEKVDIYQNLVVVKEGSQLSHSISFDFTHLRKEKETTIQIGDQLFTRELKLGFNKFEIIIPKVSRETNYAVEITTAGDRSISRSIVVKPVREWEIFLVQHTHTDIGYTRPQSEILPEHLRYIDHALDFCDQTDDYPDDAKFRWTCETSWSIREYLKSRPQSQIDRLLQRLREGRIEATGMFLNFSEIVDEPALAAQTRTLRFLKNRGIEVKTAMQNDVNGIGWSMVDLYNKTNVKYLTMGIHAHRARKPFNKPTSFWWESPAGNRLLAYRSEHYQYGNRLGVTSNQQDILRNNLSDYLRDLEAKDYPYNKISLQFSGYVTDNSPPSTEVCDIIKDWNEKYEWPRLRSSLASDFMQYLDEQHPDDLPKKQVAWPDWWTDGVGSAANETKQARQTHSSISAITGLLSMLKITGQEIPVDMHDEVTAIYDNLLFYDEHTHGAAESISDPLGQNTINQWAMKSAYVWDAKSRANLLEERALALLEPTFERGDRPTIAIINTLNWTRSGMVELFIQNTVVPEGGDFTITDMEGNEVPYQHRQQREEGAYFQIWVENIPPMGYKTLQINLGAKPIEATELSTKTIENRFYQLTIDTARGVVTRLIDKELQKELIDPLDTFTLGQFIYEQLDNRHQMERLTASTRDTVYRPLDLVRTKLQNIKVTKKENGAIYHSIFLHGDMPVCTDERGVTIEVRLYHHQKKVEFLYRMIKLPVTTPEAVYVTFPFYLEKGQLAFEVQGGVVNPGVNQLEGSSSDWSTIQNFASVRNDKAQIVFVSDEIPLVQFGDLNVGRYYYRLKPKTNHIYSWVLNNYWVTNFKASQAGELQWRYHITSTPDRSDTFATRFGWGERVPLKSRILLPNSRATSTNLTSKSLVNLDVSNLLLVNATPSMDGKGIILHLRELEGDHAILDVHRLQEQTNASSIEEVNVLEEELQLLNAPLLIEHFETKFIKMNFE